MPACLVPWYTTGIEPAELLILDFVLFMALLTLGTVYRVPLLRLKSPVFSQRVYWLGVLGLSLIFYGYVVSVFGFNFRFLSLADVYDQRLEYKDAVTAAGRAVAYALEWQANSLNPLLISVGLANKRLLLVIVGIAGQVFLFSVTGFKSVLFSILMMVAMLILFSFRRKNTGLAFVWGAFSCIVGSVVVDRFLNEPFLSSLFVRRLIVTPGLLTGYYFDFFSNNAKALLGHSIFKHIVAYPYDLLPAQMIGAVYFHNPATDANGNIWADAFANFGIPGIFVFTLLLALVMWLFDSVAAKRDFRVTALMLGIPAFTLANSALLTSLMTHGIALSLLLVYLMPRVKGTRGNQFEEHVGHGDRVKEAFGEGRSSDIRSSPL
jgi:hypothetical protein